jgi:hypothetical protein
MKVASTIASTIVTLLMLAVSVSAGGNTVSFTDRQGDLGKTWYGMDGDPVSCWSGDSPMSGAGYLDIRSGWVAVKGDVLTMGLVVDSPLTADSALPDGVSQVRWVWFFYLNTEHFWADYGVFILWDGVQFSASLMDRTSGSPPFAVAALDTFTIDGQILTVTMSMAKMPGVVVWFSETMVMHGSPWPLDQWPSSGAWHAPDLTDWIDLSMDLPWLPMP